MVVKPGCSGLCSCVQGEAPGERLQITSFTQNLDQSSIRAEKLVGTAQLKGVAETASRANRIFVLATP